MGCGGGVILMGMGNEGEFRHAIERKDPRQLLTSSYYSSGSPRWTSAVAPGW